MKLWDRIKRWFTTEEDGHAKLTLWQALKINFLEWVLGWPEE